MQSSMHATSGTGQTLLRFKILERMTISLSRALRQALFETDLAQIRSGECHTGDRSAHSDLSLWFRPRALSRYLSSIRTLFWARSSSFYMNLVRQSEIIMSVGQFSRETSPLAREVKAYADLLGSWQDHALLMAAWLSWYMSVGAVSAPSLPAVFSARQPVGQQMKEPCNQLQRCRVMAACFWHDMWLRDSNSELINFFHSTATGPARAARYDLGSSGSRLIASEAKSAEWAASS